MTKIKPKPTMYPKPIMRCKTIGNEVEFICPKCNEKMKKGFDGFPYHECMNGRCAYRYYPLGRGKQASL